MAYLKICNNHFSHSLLIAMNNEIGEFFNVLHNSFLMKIKINDEYLPLQLVEMQKKNLNP